MSIADVVHKLIDVAAGLDNLVNPDEVEAAHASVDEAPPAPEPVAPVTPEPAPVPEVPPAAAEVPGAAEPVAPEVAPGG